MDSSENARQADPRDTGPGLSTQERELVARADQRLAHAYQKIAHADEQLARVNEQMSRLERDAARKKPANRLRRPSRGSPALRGFIGLLLTAAICLAAYLSQSYGETARQMVSRFAPQLAASLPLEAAKPAAQQSPTAVQLAATDVALPQLPPPARTAPQESAAAPIPPEVTQLLQAMARDLASVQDEVAHLKAGQEELAREYSRTAQQLRESQEQTARAIASASEQSQRRRTSAPPPQPIAAPARRPVSALPPTEARAQARAPVRQLSGQQ